LGSWIQICIRIKVESWIRIRIKVIAGSGPAQSENVEAIEVHFGALEGPNLEKRDLWDPDPDPHPHPNDADPQQ
jgi:hypothetical protein